MKLGDKETYSEFADAAYDYGLNVGTALDFAPGYTVIANSHGNWSGYDGFAAFNPNDCRVVVANAGTDGFRDMLADVDMTVSGINGQVRDSMALTKLGVQHRHRRSLAMPIFGGKPGCGGLSFPTVCSQKSRRVGCGL